MADDWVAIGGPAKIASVAPAPDRTSTSAADDWAPVGGAAPTGPDAGKPSHLERIGRELLSPIIGLSQIADRIIPIPSYKDGRWMSGPDAIDATARENESKINEARGGDKGVNWERVGLDTINPVNYVGGGAGRALGAAREIAAPLAGAVSALTQPVTEGNFWAGKGKQAAEGAVAGKAAASLGGAVSRAISPTLSPAAQTLSDLGVRLTPGQMAGGAAKRAEDSLSSVPIAGSMIRSAQASSIEDFNHAALSKALAPIGVTLPKGIPAGRDAIGAAQAAISSYYDNLLGAVTFKVDQKFASDLGNLRTLVSEMPRDQREQFNRIINNRLGQRLGPTGTMDGQTYKQVESELGTLAAPLKASPDAAQKQLGTAIDEVRHQMRETLERANPQQAADLSKANQSYAMLSRVEDASMRRATADGVFTPADLVRSIQSNAKRIGGRKAFARGDSMLQDFAEAGQDVLPQKVPDSGTPERAALAGLVGGSSYMFDRPEIALGIGAAAAPYSQTGLAAARRYANPGAARKAVGAAAEQLAPYAAPAAAQAVLDIGPSIQRALGIGR